MDVDEFKCTRDEFIKVLNAENVSCAVHYPIPLSMQPAFKEMKLAPTPNSKKLSETIFSLPMYPQMSQEDIKKIILGLEKVVSHYHK